MVFVSHDGENFLEKHIFCVCEHVFLKKFLKKKQFLRVTTYFFEENFDRERDLADYGIKNINDSE